MFNISFMVLVSGLNISPCVLPVTCQSVLLFFSTLRTANKSLLMQSIVGRAVDTSYCRGAATIRSSKTKVFLW